MQDFTGIRTGFQFENHVAEGEGFIGCKLMQRRTGVSCGLV
jgi:hypothetical protein